MRPVHFLLAHCRTGRSPSARLCFRMTVVLLFETHATSEDNEAGIASGWCGCAGCRPLGESQARELGRRYSIAISRCLLLGSSVARTAPPRSHLPAVAYRSSADSRLRECHYGDLTGRPASEIEAVRGRSSPRRFPTVRATRGHARVGEVLAEIAREPSRGYRAPHRPSRDLLRARASLAWGASVGMRWRRRGVGNPAGHIS